MTRHADSVATLTELLDQQRAALLLGDVIALSRLPERLEMAMRRLADDPGDPASLAGLAQRAAHNAQLMQAARDGLARATRDRAPVAALTTYDARGRKMGGTPSGQLIARR